MSTPLQDSRCSPRSVFVKGKEKDGNTSFVDLTDSGSFIDSFNIEAMTKYAIAKAKFKKKNGHIGDNFMDSYGSTDMFERVILSMTDEEFSFFNLNIVLPRLIQIYKNEVL